MYIAKKPCHFGGKTFRVGESIPEEAIVKSRVSALIRWGMIAEVDGEKPKTDEKANEAEEEKADSAQTAQKAPEKPESDVPKEVPSQPAKTGKRGGRKKVGA